MSQPEPQPRFYSQHGEDRWITENLHLPDKGVFVDVGAYDGVNASNTLHFEQRGWTGVVIEPDPRDWVPLRYNRKCEIAPYAIGTDPAAVFQMNQSLPMSGFGRGGIEVKVPVVRLDFILRSTKIAHIDLLSIDTEGNELDVWSSFDHNEYKPQIVIIEYETAGLPSNERNIAETFANLPYRQVHRTEGNLIFERTK